MSAPGAAPLGGAWRWGRAAVVATMAAAIGTGAHTAAGGLLPGVPALVVLLVALVVGAAAVLGSPAGYGRLLALVAGGQAVVHVVLTVAAGHGSVGNHDHAHPATAARPTSSSGSALDRLAGETHGQPGEGVVDPGAADPLAHALGHLLADLSGANALMTLLHLAAAAAVAGWLLVGEQAVWALVVLAGALALARLHAVLGLLPAPVAGPRLDRPVVVVVGTPVLRSVRSGHLSRRGPPLLGLLPTPTA